MTGETFARPHDGRADGENRPPFPTRALPFVWHYVVRRRWQFGTLLFLIVGAAGCATAVQYGIRLLVDAMATVDGDRTAVWRPFLLFAGLIGLESLLWRSAGWLTCRNIIATGVEIRLDLFEHLSGHPMRYFADHLAGSLGGRIGATAGSVAGIISALAWTVLPPCTDFLGALVLFLTVDWRMAGVLLLVVAVLVVALAVYGVSGRPLHQAHAQQGHLVGGELVDTITNIWAVKAFSARARERRRLAAKLAGEAGTHAQSWLHFEKTRILHDVALWGTSSINAGLVHSSLDRAGNHPGGGRDGFRPDLQDPARLARAGLGPGRHSAALCSRQRGSASHWAPARRGRSPRRQAIRSIRRRHRTQRRLPSPTPEGARSSTVSA